MIEQPGNQPLVNNAAICVRLTKYVLSRSGGVSSVVVFARRECGSQLLIELRLECVSLDTAVRETLFVSCSHKTGRLQSPRSTIEHAIAFDGISYEVSAKLNTLANTQDQKRDVWS